MNTHQTFAVVIIVLMIVSAIAGYFGVRSVDGYFI